MSRSAVTILPYVRYSRGHSQSAVPVGRGTCMYVYGMIMTAVSAPRHNTGMVEACEGQGRIGGLCKRVWLYKVNLRAVRLDI